MRIGTTVAALTALGIVAACAPPPAPPAPPPPAPAEAPVRPPPSAPPSADWQDAPLSSGDWLYSDRLRPRAAFVQESPHFVVECTDARQIELARMGRAAAGSPLTLRTTFGERVLAASSPQSLTLVILSPSDPLLDELAYSRGRILVRVDGLPDLVLPSWPEPARVIEECRG